MEYGSLRNFNEIKKPSKWISTWNLYIYINVPSRPTFPYLFNIILKQNIDSCLNIKENHCRHPQTIYYDYYATFWIRKLYCVSVYVTLFSTKVMSVGRLVHISVPKTIDLFYFFSVQSTYQLPVRRVLLSSFMTCDIVFRMFHS